jgi:RNA polymerase sigma-70 factor (ECF subfamily)
MDSKEFKIRVLPLGNKLHRYAAGILRDVHEAEDIVQEIFLKLWNMRQQINEIQNIEAFAFRMTRNHCLDRLRASKPSLMEENLESALKNREGNSGDPENLMILNDAVKEVKRLIERLPEQQKTIIHLRDVEGYSNEEIAEIMEMEVNTVRVNVSRARKSVRETLSKTYHRWTI